MQTFLSFQLTQWNSFKIEGKVRPVGIWKIKVNGKNVMKTASHAKLKLSPWLEHKSRSSFLWCVRWLGQLESKYWWVSQKTSLALRCSRWKISSVSPTRPNRRTPLQKIFSGQVASQASMSSHHVSCEEEIQTAQNCSTCFHKCLLEDERFS